MYDTFLFALPIITIIFICYYLTKYLLPTNSLYQYVGSASLAFFTALLIYQTHGMQEMHFLAFIASILLIQFKKWQLQLPLTFFIVLHHIVLAYAQFNGYNEVYFTSENYMDLQTFIVHIALAAIIFFLCGYWAYMIKKNTLQMEANAANLQLQMDINAHNVKIASAIADGKLDSTIEYSQANELGKALKIMQINLANAQKKENADRFYNIGLTQAAEIMRKCNDDFAELSAQMLVFLIKYLQANQGGVFLLNDADDKDVHLEQTASYAYERHKFMTKKIAPNEGLIGACYQEKDIIYMTDVPETYVNITSGLGMATPTAIIIAPLLTNEKCYGVLEMAFFNTLEPFKIEFIKKVTENFASAVSILKINDKTRKLLANSQTQTEALRSQEEEMRQSMEELQATQEEMTRKNAEIEATSALNKNLVLSIDSIMARIEMLQNGTIAEANQMFLDAMHLDLPQVIGKNYTSFIDAETQNSVIYLDFWKQLSRGNTCTHTFKKLNAQGNAVWFKSIYKPIINSTNGVEKVIVLALNMTDDIAKQEKQEELLYLAQQRDEQIRGQEEIMMQSMEELMATQEEISNKNTEIIKIQSVLLEEKEKAESTIEMLKLKLTRKDKEIENLKQNAKIN